MFYSEKVGLDILFIVLREVLVLYYIYIYLNFFFNNHDLFFRLCCLVEDNLGLV